MKRREFITLLSGATVAWPLAARAQQPEKMHRIGYLTLLSGPSSSTEGFQRGLSQLGYVEGQNVVILYRWAAGRKDRLVDLAKELLQLKVDLFASPTTEAIMAIRSINETIPVVMTSVADPIGNKLVASFARPGGNTTGVTLSSTDLATKRLGLLKDVVPNLSRVAVLVERDHPPTATMSKKRRMPPDQCRSSFKFLKCAPIRSATPSNRWKEHAPMRLSCSRQPLSTHTSKK